MSGGGSQDEQEKACSEKFLDDLFAEVGTTVDEAERENLSAYVHRAQGSWRQYDRKKVRIQGVVRQDDALMVTMQLPPGEDGSPVFVEERLPLTA